MYMLPFLLELGTMKIPDKLSLGVGFGSPQGPDEGQMYGI